MNKGKDLRKLEILDLDLFAILLENKEEQ